MIDNPYRPGAGHTPPYLAGRDSEQTLFRSCLGGEFLSDNLVVTGLRGVGKTVLVERFAAIAAEERWLWVGNDLSESSSLTEERLAVRLLTDLSEALGINAAQNNSDAIGFVPRRADHHSSLTFDALKGHYESVPGLPSDKLKAVLNRAGTMVRDAGFRGVIFAYDEAQCLADHADRNEFPLSMLVETFQALQKREGTSETMLLLSGLPTLFDELTAARTYTERMFRVMSLERLSRRDTLEAVLRPLTEVIDVMRPSRDLVEKTTDLTGGYPYLIQFFGKELIDAMVAHGGALDLNAFPSTEAMERLDSGLFAARWSRTTDKQRDFLRVIAEMDPNEDCAEFSAAEISDASAGLTAKTFSNAYATQMLHALTERGIVYRTRHGRFAFTLPMSARMILRRVQTAAIEARDWRQSSPEDEIERLMQSYRGPTPPRPPAPPSAVPQTPMHEATTVTAAIQTMPPAPPPPPVAMQTAPQSPTAAAAAPTTVASSGWNFSFMKTDRR
ncbi:MAG: AAA family ATPase [Pseudomonadota bacterium]